MSGFSGRAPPTGSGGGPGSVGGARKRHVGFFGPEGRFGPITPGTRWPIIPAQINGTIPAAGAPFNLARLWQELFVDTNTPPHGTLLETRTFGREDGDFDEAVNLHPPAVLLHHRIDFAGRTQYLIESATTVHLARITQVVGGPGLNRTYRARTIDQSYEAVSNLTPIDRWPGISDYLSRPLNALVLLAVESATLMHLIAFESPELNPCPGPAAGAVSSGSFALTGGIF